VAGSDQELGAGVLDLFRFDPAIKGAILDIGRRPGAASRSTAEIVSPVGIHVNKILTALLCYPARFFVVAVAEHPLAFTPVVAGIMIGCQLMVDRLVELDTPFFNVLLQEIVDAEELNAFIRIPFLQTKPGRIVGVPSFGQDEIFALHLFVVLDDSADNLLHRLVIAGEQSPVDPFPIL
jgi:hypothetical protein